MSQVMQHANQIAPYQSHQFSENALYPNKITKQDLVGYQTVTTDPKDTMTAIDAIALNSNDTHPSMLIKIKDNQVEDHEIDRRPQTQQNPKLRTQRRNKNKVRTSKQMGSVGK